MPGQSSLSEGSRVDRVLEGKVAIITGSGAGIGLAIAKRLAAAGAKIVLSGRHVERGEAAQRLLRAASAEAVFVPADVSSEDEVRRLMETAISAFHSIAILINNAGPNGKNFGIGPLHELDSGVFDRAMKIGAYGPFWCCKYALPHMIAGGGGAIINISAVAAVRALPQFGGYAMSKSTLEALGRQVANDYAAAGIRCNTLMVGTVRPAVDDVSTLPEGFDIASLDQRIGRTTMLGTVGLYADVADAVLFLVSPQSRYITGASIPVEGGALGKLQYPDYRDALS
jgi:NAD(P)-dependent dehydrogenase (short-subunit alcohol dehydrogenase family)